MNKTLLLCILALISAQFLLGQTIRGAVFDIETQAPLSQVNIQILGATQKGTASHTDGRFSLQADSLPCRLMFSIVGYESIFKIINDTASIKIYMKAVSSELPEIVVSAERKIDTVFQEPYNVIDFIFYKDDILLLVYRNIFEKYELVLMDDNETVVSRKALKEEKPTALYKSCTDHIYLDTYFGIQEVTFSKHQINLGNWIETSVFNQIIESCVLAIDQQLFYRKYFFQGQALQYYTFLNQDILSDSLMIFPIIQDEPNIVRLIEETGNRLPWSGDQWASKVSAGLRYIREAPYSLTGGSQLFYPKIYAPIFQKDSLILLFNHQLGKLQYFNRDGAFQHEIPIEYHRLKRWKKYLLFDESHQTVYTAFHNRWGEYVCQIDLATGTLGEAVSLNLDFIEKAKVKDGVMFFLYRNPYRGAQQRMLQKVRVD